MSMGSVSLAVQDSYVCFRGCLRGVVLSSELSGEDEEVRGDVVESFVTTAMVVDEYSADVTLALLSVASRLDLPSSVDTNTALYQHVCFLPGSCGLGVTLALIPERCMQKPPNQKLLKQY